ncbi:type I polyketide synthase [Streptomyces sp. TG1A-8]|uniref:type I polyketide synthase n=1 Tax=Streptomyces sp. TG1A-8 TaxID=3051385 RepID=UPI00265C29C6|nr:type I polyketide synthase [Streptomyces sp. TG1A-8]MDO0929803.1 type I polyketide synthase [Streptomyces sp. TG1A-8]
MNESEKSQARIENVAEPIAVIGLSCRLPKANNLQDFWEMLRRGEHGITEVPEGRWGLGAEALTEPGTRMGGFLDHVDRFDAAFFSVSPREAAMMDPQQRLALELAWEALESACLAPSSLGGTRTGVFLGAISGDYATLVYRGGHEAVDRHTMTGLQRGLIANRISYHLGLRGPSMTVDAAQSSSLVAVHLACESLRSGESDLVLAGGVHLNLAPLSALAAARFGGLSPDGRSYTFDARANGFVRGEGGGLVLLKRLSRALADGDRIHGVIRGSAVNNDGMTDGLTRPDASAQEDVVRRAWASADTDPATVGYVELHGTGTRVGDPIEAAALSAALGGARPSGRPLPVGSAKTNVGHLEGAAGIIGLLKTVLSVSKGEIPASLNFAEPNPEIPLDALNLSVPTGLSPWPESEGPRRAGVSSFGMGGTNCHVVVEEAPAVEAGDVAGPVRSAGSVMPFVVSARSRGALGESAGRLAAWAEALPEDRGVPAGLAGALATGRAAFEHRGVVVAGDRAGLVAGLSAVREEAPGSAVVVGRIAPVRGRTVFVFPGQGSQWQGMSAELAADSEVFAAALRDCAEALTPYTDWDLLAVIRGDEGAPSLERVDVVQPALWAVMVSLARLWKHYGVVPDAVVGHSQGEIAAACVAGALSLEDGARIVAVRSALAGRRLAGRGGMLSVALPVAEVQVLLGQWESRASVAAVNGPQATIVAGDLDVLHALRDHCEERAIRARIVPAAFASHSPAVEVLREDLLAQLACVRPRTVSGIDFFSTVTGGRLETTALDAGYWFRNLREPVRFEPVVRGLAQDGCTSFIEASAHPVLTAAVQDTLEDAVPEEPGARLVVGSLRRDQGGLERFLLSVAEAYVHGHPVDWHVPAPDRPLPDLPTYPFQRHRYWIDTPTTKPGTAHGIDASADTQPAEPQASDASGPALVRRFLAASEQDRADVLLDAVHDQIMVILGYSSREAIPDTATFRDLGFESLTAVELRNRLAAATDLRLPSSLLYDHPTPGQLAAHLATLLQSPSRKGPEDTAAVPPTPSEPDEPIAIVAMGCRFPGGAETPEQLWRLVRDGVDAISEFPRNRGWDLDALFDPDPVNLRTSYVRHGGFLYDADRFDPEFFGISPREAAAVDPQQRLMLEVAWEALERAGIDPATLRGSRTGVYVGAMAQDYGPRLHEDAHGLEGYLLTGSTTSVASGRLAYVLGLTGPAVTVDTACSSSLVALHLAVRALRQDECSLALAGGVTVMSTPGIFLEFSRQGGLSPDGRCKPFAAAADGTGWAEGAGILALERLSDARRNGHTVLACIRGSAVNQDGASNGLTAPNGPSQEQVIRLALRDAGLTSAEIDMVEAHGTGTTLGDPIEAHALLMAYGQNRPAERPLWLGSLKSNIGHAQAAAGVGGVIKTVMAMRHGQMPRTLHVDTPTPHIDWEAGAVRLLTEERPWPESEGPRRAGVSSFGISGTNCHVVVEEAPAVEAGDVAGPVRSAGSVMPFVVSARSRGALGESAGRLAAWAEALPEDRGVPAGLAGALATGRAAFEHRGVVVAGDRAGLVAGLSAVREEAPGSAVVVGRIAPVRGRTVFVFPGQGSQWQGMSAELAADSEVFAAALRDCAEALTPYTDWDLLAVIRGDEGAPSLERVDVVQPALWAVMVSLARLWKHYGVVPDAVVGHSQGEIAAACVAGALSLEDGARIVAVRSALAGRRLAGRGGMLSVALPVAEVQVLLGQWESRASVAAVNGPQATIVAGDLDVLHALRDHCERHDTRARLVPVDYASHSSHVDPLADELRSLLADITPAPSEIDFFSTVTGGRLETTALDAGYWFRNLREPVRFEPVVRGLAQDGCTSFIEASAHPVLTAAVQDTLEDAVPEEPGARLVVGSLRRDQGGLERFLLSVAEAYVHGHPVDWHVPAPDRPLPDLPTYPFQRHRYWIDTPTTKPGTAHGIDASAHPLLGGATELADYGGLLLTGRVSAGTHPWLADHAVAGRVLLPGAALVELALHAGARLGCARLANLALETPLLLPERGAARLQVAVGPADEAGRRSLSVHSRPDNGDEDTPWTRHATATLVAPPAESHGSSTAGPVDGLAGAWPPPGAEPVPVHGLYDRLAAAGYEYGPAFQGLRALWRRGDELLADVALPAEVAGDADRYEVHPALLDAALHAAVSGAEAPHHHTGPRLPFAWSGVDLSATGASALRVRIVPVGTDTYAVSAADPEGHPVLTADSLTFRRPRPGQFGTAGDAARLPLYGVEWTALPAPAAAPGTGFVLVGTQPLGTAVRPIHPDHPDLRALGAVVDASTAPPRTVFLVCPVTDDGTDTAPQAAEEAARFALTSVREWLADRRFDDARLVLVTGDPLAHATVWGLVRSAQTEHPDRFALLELDGEVTDHTLAYAATLSAQEPQLRLRDGEFLAPRLARAATAEAPDTLVFDPDGTVVITGATGLLGGLLARHLCDTHGVRHLLLVGRRGAQADGMPELLAQLAERGARVTAAACDVADRDALAALLDTIPAEHPLTAVVHAAGVLDDAPVTSLTDDQLERVLLPKVTAAARLHELTLDRNLTAFVLFSSVAGVLGTPGQANYAAANAYLDALARHRHERGLPAVSLAWGLWSEGSGMTGHLTDVDLGRMARAGVAALHAAEGLALFDRALAVGGAEAVPARLSLSAVRERAASGSAVPPLLRGLVRAPARRAAGAAIPAALPAAPEEEALLELVRQHAAAVLGYPADRTVEKDRTFQDLGMDSLTSVELRNRLNEATGLRLPATLLFDHPTPLALAARLRAEYAGAEPSPAESGESGRGPGVAADEPIAIVGMSCRFPGGVRSPEELWQLVATGTDAIGDFPGGRGWDLENLYHPDPGHQGTFYASAAGFLDDADAAGFDAAFFGISPREALAMDPQQRMLLETAWEAVERAGLDPWGLKGSRTGVFIGAMASDYPVASAEQGQDVEGYVLIGTSGSVLSGRLAYTFGWEGPAVTVDTACSSSLVALHLAAQALRRGECGLALTGGVTVMATPRTFIEFSRQRGLAADGRCKSFADAADGTGWAEGAGVLLLERLSDARRHGHRVLAVIRGSAVNQDGASNGLTAPNGPAQQRVIRDALRDAGLAGVDVDAVEAHGTGTRLGDPIEAQAILATYGRQRPADRPLRLGSLKSNIGHAQAAAGVGGVIKMVMAMRHGILPKTLHIDQPSTHVDWSTGAVELLTEHLPWPDTGQARRAGVSSFGISGTNAHVILELDAEAVAEPDVPEAAPRPDRAADAAARESAVAWTLTAKSPEALREQAVRLGGFVRSRTDLDPAAVGRALAFGRARFEYRAVVTGTSPEELLAGLDVLAAEAPEHGEMPVPSEPTVAFLFTGQGAQYEGMGRELYERHEVFAAALDEVCAQLDRWLPAPLLPLLLGAAGPERAGDLDRTGFTQPALFAYEVALFRLLESWGLHPDHIAGHSVGEIAAAHVAGMLSLAEVAKLVAARGSLMQALPARGAMAALQIPEADVLRLLEGRTDAVSVAAVNGPASVVVAGDEDAVLEIAEQVRAQGRKVRRLRVSHAFHSPHMDAVLDDFRAVAERIDHRAPHLSFVSSVTGQPLGEEPADAEYWVRHARAAVRFSDAVDTLADLGTTLFVEIGPDGVLTAMAQETLAARAGNGAGVACVPAQRKDRPQVRTLVDAVARAHAHGADVDWGALLGRDPVHRDAADLPTYPFRHQRYWPVPGDGQAGLPAAGLAPGGHPLLRAAVSPADSATVVFTGRLSLGWQAWLADHAVLGTVLVPGAVLLELALHAGGRTGCPQVAEFVLEAPLALPEKGAVDLQVVVGAPGAGPGPRPIAVYARPAADGAADAGAVDDRPWTRHAAGTLRPEATVEPGTAVAWPPDGAVEVPLHGLYDRLADAGFVYGPAFAGLQRAWLRGKEIFAEVALSDRPDSTAGAFGIWPPLVDAALNAVKLDGGDDGRLPFAFSGAVLHPTDADALRVRVVPRPSGGHRVEAYDVEGCPVLLIEELSLRQVSADAMRRAAGGSRTLHRLDWVAAPAPDGSTTVPRTWAVVDASGLLGALPADVPGHPDLAACCAAFDAGAPVPDAVVLTAAADGDDSAVTGDAVQQAVVRALGDVQTWLADERFARTRLVVLTRGAVGLTGDEGPHDLAHAAVWGLVRTAQTENPGRFTLVDVAQAPVLDDLTGLLGRALATGEPQIAVRGEARYVPRIVRQPLPAPSAGDDGGLPFSGDGTVLLTGATGALGRLVARHLVTAHGVRDLLLVSRSGPAAPDASALTRDLSELGARVSLVAADLADRAQVDAVLAAVPADHPLQAVVHAAGVLDDGVLPAMTPARVRKVLRAKADAALHLHDATRALDLTAFVLFSSAAGVLGTAGQANYAAANAFLDALAEARAAIGLPATSLAWGLWDTDDGMAADLGNAGRRRLARSGVVALAVPEALALFDAACADRAPVAVPVHLDLPALRARSAEVAPVLRALVPHPGATRTSRPDAPAREPLAGRLARLSPADRAAELLSLVRSQAAGVLGFPNAKAVPADRGFLELGFDSLTAVEFRNRINRLTGLSLPPTVLFDHPEPMLLAARLDEELGAAATPGQRPADSPAGAVGSSPLDLDRLEQWIEAALADDATRNPVVQRLQRLLAGTAPGTGTGAAAPGEPDDDVLTERIDAADDDEIFDLIDNDLGVSS